MLKYPAIDSIRGILALLIVWFHFDALRDIHWGPDWGPVIVLFFFILSGFHLTLTYQERIDKVSYKEFLIKRCSKIFPIQWIAMLPYIVFNTNIVALWAIPFHVFLIQSLCPLWTVNFTLNTPAWFLSSLFVCYLVTIPLIRYGKCHLNKFLTTLVASIIIFNAIVYFMPSSIGHRWPVYINPVSRILDFSIGIALGLMWKNHERRVEQNKVVYTIAEILACVLFFIPTLPFFSKFLSYHITMYPFVVFLISVFTKQLGWISQLLSNWVLNTIGKISMSIYMVHFFILLSIQSSSNLYVDLFVSYALTLILSFILSKYCLPYCQRLWQSTAKRLLHM